MSKLLIVGNWKMNPATLDEAGQLFNSIKKGLKNIKTKKVEVVVCPPFVYLTSFKFQVSNLKLGAQNCFWQEKGAFTGEISAKMLKNLGCQHVIIGHSERRRYFGETDEEINQKIKAVISAKLSPILCVGESEKERKEGKTKKVLESQLNLALKDISKLSILNSKFSITYEPVWAISTSKDRKDCPPEEIQIMGLLLRKILARKYGSGVAYKIRILFGGNVNSQNARAYFEEGKVQGFIVGGASLNAKEFLAVIKEAKPLIF